jgi:hypothetical protein
MSLRYKENVFSTESHVISSVANKNNIKIISRPNIDHLIKKIIVARRREKETAIIIGVVFFSIILMFIFFQN